MRTFLPVRSVNDVLCDVRYINLQVIKWLFYGTLNIQDDSPAGYIQFDYHENEWYMISEWKDSNGTWHKLNSESDLINLIEHIETGKIYK